jgi:hypothetical protein
MRRHFRQMDGLTLGLVFLLLQIKKAIWVLI